MESVSDSSAGGGELCVSSDSSKSEAEAQRRIRDMLSAVMEKEPTVSVSELGYGKYIDDHSIRPHPSPSEPLPLYVIYLLTFWYHCFLHNINAELETIPIPLICQSIGGTSATERTTTSVFNDVTFVTPGERREERGERKEEVRGSARDSDSVLEGLRREILCLNRDIRLKLIMRSV